MKLYYNCHSNLLLLFARFARFCCLFDAICCLQVFSRQYVLIKI